MTRLYIWIINRIPWRVKVFFQTMIDFFLQLIYFRHNARVIADFEHRMSEVIHRATNYRMSKTYYDLHSMLSEIEGAFEDEYEKGYDDAKEECESCGG